MESLPTFCGYLNDRFDRGWEMTRHGAVTPTLFRRATRDYEAMLGCRVYSPEYLDRFYGCGHA